MLQGRVKEVFQGMGISVTNKGKGHLGAAVGTPALIKRYFMRKVFDWVNTIECLSSSSLTRSHAAYHTALRTSGLTFLE